MIIHNAHFNTYPIIFHHHGQRKWSNHPMGLPLKKQFFEDIANGGELGMFRDRKIRVLYPIPASIDISNIINDQLTIFMVTNLEEEGSAARCLDYYGIKYNLVGKDITNFNGEEKYKEIIKFIPKIKTRYVMLLDSDDIFITNNLSNLVETFEQEYDCQMLFQAEGWNFPKGDNDTCKFEMSVVDNDNPYKHLNSGIWIANTDFLKNVYEDLINIKPHTPGDQPRFKLLYKKYYPNIKIDSFCKYFQSLAWSGWFEKHYPGVLNLGVKNNGG